jgi:hypothetical protein
MFTSERNWAAGKGIIDQPASDYPQITQITWIQRKRRPVEGSAKFLVDWRWDHAMTALPGPRLPSRLFFAFRATAVRLILIHQFNFALEALVLQAQTFQV